jgi:hypothetical protein
MPVHLHTLISCSGSASCVNAADESFYAESVIALTEPQARRCWRTRVAATPADMVAFITMVQRLADVLLDW